MGPRTATRRPLASAIFFLCCGATRTKGKEIGGCAAVSAWPRPRPTIDKKRAAPIGYGPSLGRKRQSHGRERTNPLPASMVTRRPNAGQRQRLLEKRKKTAPRRRLLSTKATPVKWQE